MQWMEIIKNLFSNLKFQTLTTMTKTEKGNFFKVEAEISLTDAQAKKIRYGIEGRSSQYRKQNSLD